MWTFARIAAMSKQNLKGRKMETRNEVCEREHDFALVLTGAVGLPEGAEDALFEAGCDDATLSVRSGRVYLTFSRIAPTLKAAMLSAIQDVRKAKIGLDVLRVDDCNLVTQSDIARRISRTRQLVHQYINGERGPGGFPSPACHICDESPLWYWCEVSYWLWQNDMIKQEVLREAEDVAVINAVLELRHQRKSAPGLAEEIMQSIDADLARAYAGSHEEG
jgi:hypothetical protein